MSDVTHRSTPGHISVWELLSNRNRKTALGSSVEIIRGRVEACLAASVCLLYSRWLSPLEPKWPRHAKSSLPAGHPLNCCSPGVMIGPIACSP